MNFTLKILGTASAMPFSDRNPSAQALNVHGRLFLIDCGEGTQQQIRRYHLSFVKIEAIFISHVHGDHVFGIFGLLSTMSMFHRTAALKIFAPSNFAPILEFYQKHYADKDSFEIEFTPLEMKAPEQIYELPKHLRVSAFPLNHKIPCYGFRFDEIVSSRRNPWTPRSFAYCSDTAPFPQLAEWVKGVDLLYHEATYPKELKDKAVQYFHSTTEDAAACALSANAGKLVVAHYSSRVKDKSVFETECKQIFANSYAADDGDEFEIDYIRSV